MRCSKQRTAILDFVRESCSHPTASEVYDGVRTNLPQISLGTVYRNLIQLCEAGMIAAVEVGDGPTRFDRRIDEHQHYRCRSCNKLFDVETPRNSLFTADLESSLPGTLEAYSAMFYGICEACQDRKDDMDSTRERKEPSC